MTDIRYSITNSIMACRAKHPGKNNNAGRTLLGLTAEESKEFVRLDRLASKMSKDDTPQWSAAEERRWVELFEKKHAATMAPFLTKQD